VLIDPEEEAGALVWDFTDFNAMTGQAGSPYESISQDVFVRGIMSVGAAVPEPSTLVFALVGLIGSILAVRRRQRRV